MAREIGNFPTSANFELKKESSLDARQYVNVFSELLQFTAADYIPEQFPVTVKNDETIGLTLYKAGGYRCIDKTDLSNPASWKQEGGGTDFNGTTNTIPRFINAGDEIGDSNIRQVSTTQFSFGILTQQASLRTTNLTANRDYIFQNKGGIIAHKFVNSALITTLTYTIQETDAYVVLRRSNAAANTSTLTLTKLALMAVDDEVVVRWVGAGQSSVVLESGITADGYGSKLTFKIELSGQAIMIKKISDTIVSIDGNVQIE